MYRLRRGITLLMLPIFAVLSACDDGAIDPSNIYEAVDGFAEGFRNQSLTLEIGAAGAGSSNVLSVEIVVPPEHGDLSGVPTTLTNGAQITYTPDPDYVGGDYFVYELSRNGVRSQATGRVQIRNRAPSAAAVTEVGMANTAIDVSLTGSDPDGDALVFEIFQQPSNGTLGAVQAEGSDAASVVYTPAAGYEGSDSFTYRAWDGLEWSAPATVDITVAAEITAISQAVETNEDRAVDIDLRAESSADVPVTFSIIEQPSNGHLIGSILAAGGTTEPVLTQVTYVPDPEYSGPDSFTFEASTGGGVSSSATVDITVIEVDDPPSFTVGPDIMLAANQPPQSFPSWATDISAGPGESFGADAGFVLYGYDTSLFDGPITVSLDGTLAFTPDAPATGGSTEVTVQLADGTGQLSAQQTFTITIEEAPDPCAIPEGVISLGQTVAGQLTATDCQITSFFFETTGEHFADRWEFTLTATTDVVIDMTSSGTTAATFVDSWLYAVDPGVTDPAVDGFIARDDDGGAGLNSRITQTLAPGTYVIFATTYFPGDEGNYSLSLSEVLPPS